jgi:hypothetical protein
VRAGQSRLARVRVSAQTWWIYGRFLCFGCQELHQLRNLVSWRLRGARRADRLEVRLGEFWCQSRLPRRPHGGKGGNTRHHVLLGLLGLGRVGGVLGGVLRSLLDEELVHSRQKWWCKNRRANKHHSHTRSTPTYPARQDRCPAQSLATAVQGNRFIRRAGPQQAAWRALWSGPMRAPVQASTGSASPLLFFCTSG